MAQGRKSNEEPVTVVFSWSVTAGKEVDFQKWMHIVHAEASKWPGHLGVTTIRPPKGRYDYQTVLRFDSHKHLQNWLDSPKRNELMDTLGDIAKLHTEEASGLETWFDIPGQLVMPPPRWKMAVTTMIAIYPIALVVDIFIVPHTTNWSVIFRAIIIPIIGPLILTYSFMPYLTQKILRNWLYKKR